MTKIIATTTAAAAALAMAAPAAAQDRLEPVFSSHLVVNGATTSPDGRLLLLGRAATLDDVAAVIAFLASEDARFVNGVILPVDGGLGASNVQPDFLSLLGQA